MPNLSLRRVWSDATGTFGVLSDPGGPFAVTVELPWKMNEPRVSCIPTGTYLCQRVNSPKFGNTWEITAVAGRSHILFHKGNSINDLLGCVAVGESFNPVGGVRGITESAKGFAEFLLIQKEAVSFTLIIT